MFSKSQHATLVPIKKMNRAIKFYTKSLGGKLVGRAGGKMRDSWASVDVAGAQIWLVRPDKREKHKLAYSAFVTDDIRADVKELQKRGIKFSKATKTSKRTKVEGPIAIEPFGGIAYFEDTEGNLLMLWQGSAMK